MPLPEGPLEESVYDSYAPPELAPRPERPGPAAEEQAPEGAAGEPELPKFDERHREEFEGLLYVGALTKTFSWLGHRFVIRTLRTAELTQVSLAVKEHIGSDGYLKSWQGALVAACVVSVDGRPLPVVPLTNMPDDTMIAANYRWVMDHWFPPVLDRVYEEYLGLEITVRKVIEDMGKVSG